MPVAVRPLRLLGAPIVLLRATADHNQRLLETAEAAVANDAPGLSSTLAITVRALSDEYADLSTVTSADVDRAEAAGAPSVDLALDAPVTMVSAAETWLRLIEHLEDLAAAGDFVAEPTPPDIDALRRWLVDEIVGQLREGRAARAFPSPPASD